MISAEKKDGELAEIKIIYEQRKHKFKLPDVNWHFVKKDVRVKNLPDGFMELSFQKEGEFLKKMDNIVA